MKKINNVLKYIVLILLFITLVKNKHLSADMGMVNWDPYYAWCIRKEGIDLRTNRYGEGSVHVPYGARLYIWHGGNPNKAYDANDYYLAYFDDYSFGYYNETVKGSDIRPVSKNPDQALLSYSDLKLLTIDKVDVYDGPGTEFKKVFVLDPRTSIESDYNDGTWAHIAHDNYEGWVYFKQTSTKERLPDVVIQPNSNIQIHPENDNVIIYDSLNGKSSNKYIVKNVEELKFLGVQGSCYSINGYYVEAEGERGWVTDDGDNHYSFITKDSKLYTNDNTILYKDINGEDVATIIQAGDSANVTKIAFDENDKERYYCEYDGIYGWASAKANCFVDSSITNNYEKAHAKKDLEVYNFPNNAKTNSVIHKDEKILVLGSTTLTGSTWYYVKNNATEGWVQSDIEYYKTENIEESTVVDSDSTNRNIPDIFYYYVVGAIVFSVSAFVLLKTINLRKKAK